MTKFVDTNVLIRHLTGDPPARAKRATTFLRTARDLVVVDLVAAEMVYVLESFYKVDRSQVAESLRAVVAFPSISVADEALLLRAVEVYEDDRLDFAEAYLVAAAEVGGAHRVASFDRSIDRVATVTRVEP